MTTLHPASWFAVWCAVALLVQRLPLPQLTWAALLLLPPAFVLSGRLVLILLRRARWLLLAIAVMFLVATPGERLPGAVGSLGLSVEGAEMAASHLLRLILMLATLGWLQGKLGREGMMAGLYVLLLPMARWRKLRERIMVRLQLALDFVEEAGDRSWREWLGDGESTANADELAALPLQLIVPPLRPRDRGVLAMAIAVGATTLVWL